VAEQALSKTSLKVFFVRASAAGHTLPTQRRALLRKPVIRPAGFQPATGDMNRLMSEQRKAAGLTPRRSNMRFLKPSKTHEKAL
jgi:hypothetical protein